MMNTKHRFEDAANTFYAAVDTMTSSGDPSALAAATSGGEVLRKLFQRLSPTDKQALAEYLLERADGASLTDYGKVVLKDLCAKLAMENENVESVRRKKVKPPPTESEAVGHMLNLMQKEDSFLSTLGVGLKKFWQRYIVNPIRATLCWFKEYGLICFGITSNTFLLLAGIALALVFNLTGLYIGMSIVLLLILMLVFGYVYEYTSRNMDDTSNSLDYQVWRRYGKILSAISPVILVLQLLAFSGVGINTNDDTSDYYGLRIAERDSKKVIEKVASTQDEDLGDPFAFRLLRKLSGDGEIVWVGVPKQDETAKLYVDSQGMNPEGVSVSSRYTYSVSYKQKPALRFEEGKDMTEYAKSNDGIKSDFFLKSAEDFRADLDKVFKEKSPKTIEEAKALFKEASAKYPNLNFELGKISLTASVDSEASG